MNRPQSLIDAGVIVCKVCGQQVRIKDAENGVCKKHKKGGEK